MLNKEPLCTITLTDEYGYPYGALVVTDIHLDTSQDQPTHLVQVSTKHGTTTFLVPPEDRKGDSET